VRILKYDLLKKQKATKNISTIFCSFLKKFSIQKGIQVMGKGIADSIFDF